MYFFTLRLRVALRGSLFAYPARVFTALMWTVTVVYLLTIALVVSEYAVYWPVL